MREVEARLEQDAADVLEGLAGLGLDPVGELALGVDATLTGHEAEPVGDDGG